MTGEALRPQKVPVSFDGVEPTMYVRIRQLRRAAARKEKHT